ncbi:MAG: hypothetical protein ABSH33_09910 [Steroidobacteraceae bacterium]|jgi:hypothetical protein
MKQIAWTWTLARVLAAPAVAQDLDRGIAGAPADLMTSVATALLQRAS